MAGKFFPGDPLSPYLVGKRAKPKIPAVSVSYEMATILLSRFANARKVPNNLAYNLPLNTELERAFDLTLEVNTEDSKIDMKNVIGTLPGRYGLSEAIDILEPCLI